MSESWIAQAAAHAELLHDDWEEVNPQRVKKEFGYGAHGHVRTTVTLDTHDGSWEAETIGGEMPQAVLEGWVRSAQEVVSKWPPRIEEVFSKWRDMPEEYEFDSFAASYDHAAAELALSPNEEGSLLGNARLSGDLDNLRQRTGELNGRYAEAFRENYVAPLQPAMANQGALVTLLAVAVHTQAALWGQTSADLMDIEDKAEQAMVASAPSGDSGSDALVVLLTAVGALAAGAAAMATAGSSLAVAVSLLGGSSSAVGSLISHFDEGEQKPKEMRLGAGHPNGVFTNLKKALDELDNSIEAQERKVVTLLNAGLDLTSARAPHSDLRLKRSGIATAAPGQVLEAEQLLTVDEGTVAKITELWLPTIAADLRSARKEMDADVTPWRRPVGIGLEPKGAWPEFRDLQTALAGIIGATANELDDAAIALQQAARLIGLSDEGANRRFGLQADRIIKQDV